MVEEEDARPHRSSPSLGTVVSHLIKKSQMKVKRKRRRKVKKCDCGDDDKTSAFVNTNTASSTPLKMFGKNAMVYEERQDALGDRDDGNATLDEEAPAMIPTTLPTPELDIKLSTVLRLAADSVLPNDLRNVFGSTYVESMSQPHRFAIDISQRVSGAAGKRNKAYVLFEVLDDNNNNSVCKVEGLHQIQDWNGFVNVR